MATGFFIAGVVLVILSVVIHFVLQRRRFYRRNQAGIETFNSYSSSVFTRVLEGLLRLLSIAMFLGGLFICIISYMGR